MSFRAILVAASIATAAIGSASLAGAAPASQSPSYQDGYKSEHDFYSIPKNHTFLKNEMQQGYNTAWSANSRYREGRSPRIWTTGYAAA